MLHLTDKIGAAGLLLLSIIAFASCDNSSLPPPKVNVGYWTVSGIGGPIELRPLPPAGQVVADFDRWLDSQTATNARVYEVKVSGASNQLNFAAQVRRGETPMGRPEHTYVSFIYKDPTNGSYEFFWDRLGRHSAGFLKLSDKPKRVWVVLNRMASQEGLPKLEIVAFEGVGLGGGVIAQPGRRSPQ